MRKLIFAFLLAPLAFGQGSQLQKYTVATLPSATTYKTYTVQVIDGTTGTDCTVGGASGTSAHNVVCTAQYNGSAWVWGPVSSNYVLPQATTVTLGGIKPDGTTCTTTSGVLTCTGSGSGAATYITADGTGTPPTNYQVLTAGANVTLTPGTHTLTITSTGGSSGVQYNSSNTTYYIVGDSIAGVSDSSCFETSLPSDTSPITAGSITGGVASFTGTNTFDATCVTILSGFSGGYTGLNGQLCVVSATGLSGSAFQCPVTAANGSTGTGQAQARYNLTGRLVNDEPYTAGHGTVVNNATSNQTLAQMNTAYATTAHLYSPAVTGHPAFLIIFNGTQDLYNGRTDTQIEADFQTYWATARADNWTGIIQTAIVGLRSNSSTAQTYWANVNRWLLAQGPTNANILAGHYYDRYVPLDNILPNGYDPLYFGQTGAAGHMSDMASKLAADYINMAFSAQGSTLALNPNGARSFGGQLLENGPSVSSALATPMMGILDPTTAAYDVMQIYNNGGTGIPIETVNGGLLDGRQIISGSAVRVLPSNGVIGWNSGSTAPGAYTNAPDVALSRDAAGVLDIGDGSAAGVSNRDLKLRNITISGGCTGCPSSGVSGMTTGQVGVAGSPTTITNSKAIAGSGAGLTSGPTSSTSGDVATFSGTSGQIQDSSVLLSSLALLASPTFTGVPAAPTATGGTNTTQLATTAFVQAAIAAAGTGAGIVTYSGPSLTFTGTQYFPIGGGATSSTTETNVDIDAPAAVTIQNMTVQMSAAPGVGATIVFTWRKNAAGTVLTCTISGASATSCSDTTHNFSTASLDLLDIQTVTTGTVVGTPTVIMAAQVGVAATATTAFSAISGGTNTGAAMVVGSGASLAPSGTGTINANQINGGTVPTSASVLGSNGSNQPVTATGHAIAAIRTCADTSGSGTAQTCSTSPTFTPTTGDQIIYTTTTSNSGTGLTVNVNSLGAKSVAKWQTTTTLAVNDVRANTQIMMTYDGTNWEMGPIGNAPSGGGALTQISQQVLGSPASSITFSAIAGTYTNLKLTIMGQSSSASNDFVSIQVNGDTGSNYDYGGFNGTTSTGNVAGFSTTATTSMFALNVNPSSATSRASTGECRFNSYANTSFYKGMNCEGFYWNGTFILNTTNSGNWKSTAAITSVVLKLNSGSNFVTGTVVTLYGEQ